MQSSCSRADFGCREILPPHTSVTTPLTCPKAHMRNMCARQLRVLRCVAITMTHLLLWSNEPICRTCACCRQRLSPRFARRLLLSSLAKIEVGKPKKQQVQPVAKRRSGTSAGVGLYCDLFRDVTGWRPPAIRQLEEWYGDGKAGGSSSSQVVIGKVQSAIQNTTENLREYLEQMGVIQPYIRLLKESIGTNVRVDNYEVIEQGGFQALNDIAEGRRPMCCICHSNVSDDVAVTRCMHFACATCCITWYSFGRQQPSAHSSHQAAARGVPCPLCRQPFTLDNLIVVQVGDGRRSDTHGTAPMVADASSAAESASTPPAAGDLPGFVAAAVLTDYSAIPMPAGGAPRMNGRYPALCVDGGCFLAHHGVAAVRYSPKVQRTIVVYTCK
jgi:hypothetical protein